MRRLDWLLLLSCLCAHPLAGCGDDGSPATDAAPPDAAPVADAADPDAAPDAAVPCPGQALFTGSYQDWDTNSAGQSNTLGAVVAQADDPENSMTITAPNGRVSLCLPADQTSEVTFTKDEYLPLRYTFDPMATGTAFEIQGLTPGRADELFTELGVTRDPLLAQVIVAVRYETYNPEAVGAGVDGVRVSLGNAAAGTFTLDEGGVLVAGDTLDGGAFVLFANTELGSGTSTITVTTPFAVGCVDSGSVSVNAGEIAVTTITCWSLPV
ncbi:MAG TPA: hypothetical protein VNM90_01065 [Haliangium sp.]|nr:hypothetical protein [Haliangium sp.]